MEALLTRPPRRTLRLRLDRKSVYDSGLACEAFSCCTLDGAEFLRRFLLHAVPGGFMRIRHFGLFANRYRSQNLATCRSLLSVPISQEPDPSTSLMGATSHARCPACGRGRLIAGPNLSPLELSRLTIRLDSS